MKKMALIPGQDAGSVQMPSELPGEWDGHVMRRFLLSELFETGKIGGKKC